MNQGKRSRAGAALGLGALGAMVLCCAVPLFLAGGALAATGDLLLNPLLIAAGVIVTLVTVVRIGMRRNRHACCRANATPPVRTRPLERLAAIADRVIARPPVLEPLAAGGDDNSVAAKG